MKYLDNYQFVQEVLAGNEKAIEQFCKIYIPILKKNIRITLSHSGIHLLAAEIDVVANEIINWFIYGISLNTGKPQSNSFLKDYDGETYDLETYIIQKSRGEILNHMKKYKKGIHNPVIVSLDSGYRGENDSTETDAEVDYFELPKIFNDRQELEKMIKTKYGFLSDEEVKALTLFAMDYTYEEIGEELNLENKSLSYRRVTAHRIVSRALEKIKKLEGIK